MKLDFKKIIHTDKTVHLCVDSKAHSFLDEGECVVLRGEIARKDNKLVKFTGNISGNLVLTCVKTGEDFVKDINEELVLFFSDGIWETQSQSNGVDLLDVIEFFEGFIDFDFVLESEIESIRLDYNIKE